MKRILIVGGGVNQMPLIFASKREGYDVIVVDYAGERCPAYGIADKLYNESTQDEEAIFEVALQEKIDGIISNSEPSMLVVNSIAEKLGLIGNSVDGIKNLISKSRFRDLQCRVGAYAPDYYEVATTEEAVFVSQRINYPIIIKPCESSGSRGCRRIEQYDYRVITEAFQECKRYSRNGKVIIEGFIPNPSLQTIEGDIFVYGDSILWDGLFYTTRASWAPMVPMTYTAPLLIDNDRLGQIKSAVSQLLRASDIRFGEFNIEGFFTETDQFFIIEINARQGGNFLPRFVQGFTGIDYNRLLVTGCVDEYNYYHAVMTSERSQKFSILHSVYSKKEGYYQGLKFATSIKDKITNIIELLAKGDKVEKCIDGTSIVASVDLEFDSLEDLYAYTPIINDCIQVELSDD